MEVWPLDVSCGESDEDVRAVKLANHRRQLLSPSTPVWRCASQTGALLPYPLCQSLAIPILEELGNISSSQGCIGLIPRDVIAGQLFSSPSHDAVECIVPVNCVSMSSYWKRSDRQEARMGGKACILVSDEMSEVLILLDQPCPGRVEVSEALRKEERECLDEVL